MYMISIITQRCAASLTSLSENQLKVLTQRTTSILYRDFHNIVMGVNDIETTDIVNSLNETHNNVIKSLKEEHKNELDEISNNYIDEIHSMTLKIEKIREDLRFESDMRIKSLQDIHNEGLLQKENETLFYKNEIEEIKIKSETEINYFKELLQINQSNLDSLKEEFYKVNSRTNIKKGDIGEQRVIEALNDNARYNDISIEDVSDVQGSGDIVVCIPSIDISMMIEVKNESVIQKGKDILQFDEHKEKFFKDHSNSHAMFISLNTDRIPNFGSYNIINKNGSFTGYFSKKDMNIDEIKYNFYNFIDIILNNRNMNNKNDNMISFCDSLSDNTLLISDIVQDYQKKIKFHQEQVKINEEYVNKLNNTIKSNNILLKEEGYSVSSALVCKTKEEKFQELKNYLIENQIYSINYNKAEFKSNWTKKQKENELYKKDKVLFKFNLPKSTGYDSIFEELSK